MLQSASAMMAAVPTALAPPAAVSLPALFPISANGRKAESGAGPTGTGPVEKVHKALSGGANFVKKLLHKPTRRQAVAAVTSVQPEVVKPLYPRQLDGFVTPVRLFEFQGQFSISPDGLPLWVEHLAGNLGTDKTGAFNRTLKATKKGQSLTEAVKGAKVLFLDGFQNQNHPNYWNAISQRLQQRGIHDSERLSTNGVQKHEFNAPTILNGVLKAIRAPNGPRNVILVPHSKGASDADVAFSRRYMQQQGKTPEEMALIERHLAIGSLQGVHGFAHQSHDAMMDTNLRYPTVLWVQNDLNGDPATIDEMTYYGRHNTRVRYPRNPNIKYFALATYDGKSDGEYPKMAREAEEKYDSWQNPFTFERRRLDARNDGRLFWQSQLPGNTPYALVSGVLHDLPWNLEDAKKSADLIETLIRMAADRLPKS